MKKTLALFAVLVMILMMSATAAFAEDEAYVMNEELFNEIYEQVEYAPNPDYAQFTVVEWYMEDLDTTMYAMVSANEDLTEFYNEVFWYGVDDQGLLRYDPETDTFEVIEDSSGFNHMVAPSILRVAMEQNYWKPMSEAEIE